jgi:predicted AlkP superfamily pyrophosphatase or phosphodiesterase
MKKLHFSLLLFTLLFGTFSFAQNDSTRKYKTEKVIIMVMDGPRYTETWGDSTHQNIPHLAKDIVPQGVLYSNFRNNGKTETTAGHTALTTGFYQRIPNNGTVLPKNPSIFQYYLKEKGKIRKAAYVIASKDKLSVLTDCKKKDWHGKYRPIGDCGENGRFSQYRTDQVTYENSVKILTEEKPDLVLINFKNPDTWGHAGNWERYLSSMKKTDEYIYKLFKLIQTNEHYRGKTTVFITNDHGRHLDGKKDGFISHGDCCEGCRRMICLAYGPDFKQNVISDVQREQIDIPVTIGELLGFDIPKSKGKVMTELFVNSETSN